MVSATELLSVCFSGHTILGTDLLARICATGISVFCSLILEHHTEKDMDTRVETDTETETKEREYGEKKLDNQGGI